MNLNQFVLIALVNFGFALEAKTQSFVKANADSLIQLESIKDFNSQSVNSWYPKSKQNDEEYAYYIGSVTPINTLNGIVGLLQEWGSQNAIVRNLLDTYPEMKKNANKKVSSIDEIKELPSNYGIISMMRVSWCSFLLMEYARQNKQAIYEANLNNASFLMAVNLLNQESNKLLRKRNQFLKDYITTLKASGNDVYIDKGFIYLKIGSSSSGYGTYDNDLASLDSIFKAELKIVSEQISRAYQKLTSDEIRKVKVSKMSSSRFGSDKSKAEFLLSMSKLVSPDAYGILSRIQNHSLFAKYERDTSLQGMWEGFNTVVHESCHHINEFPNSYYVSDKISIPYKTPELFNSNELTKIIPVGEQKIVSRFDPYIIPKQENQGSQRDGIYGLLDEFNAYFISSKFDWELVTQKSRVYKQYPSYKNSLENYRITTQEAFYEFSIMMAWYLDYANKKYPVVYKTIIEDKNLKVAFTLLFNKFQNLIVEVEKPDIYKLGVRSSDDLKKLFKETRNSLQPLIVAGCNEVNYKQFLN